MPRHTSKLVFCLVLTVALTAGCAADRPPHEVTADGLVRVPSRSIGGVYRAPDATFTQYRRVILEPPSISFVREWAEKYPEVGATEVARIRTEMVQLFREEFTREFVKRGPYRFADDPAPDVLLVVPNIEELDITPPDVGDGSRIATNGRPVSMTVTGDLRDAVTGRLVGRVIMYRPAENYGLRGVSAATRVGIAKEQRMAFAEWSGLVHEALNVAKAEKPRPPQTVDGS